jgi:YVTN family beta-propeller protein
LAQWPALGAVQIDAWFRRYQYIGSRYSDHDNPTWQSLGGSMPEFGATSRRRAVGVSIAAAACVAILTSIMAAPAMAAPGAGVSATSASATSALAASVSTTAAASPLHSRRKPAILYVANLESGSVSRINTATNRAERPVTLGRKSVPFAIVTAPNGRTVYVANYGTSTVTPISTRTGRRGKAIKVPRGPDYLAITPNGKTLYVASEINSNDQEPGRVTPISTATRKAGRPLRVGIDPGPIEITPDSKSVYVATAGLSLNGVGNVTVIKAVAHRVRAVIRLADPLGMVLTPDGRKLYVASENDSPPGCSPPPAQSAASASRTSRPPGSPAAASPAALCGQLIPIRTATDRPGRRIRIGDPAMLAVAPGGQAVYVLTDSGAITKVSTRTSKVGWSARPVGNPYYLAITPNGRTLYALGDTTSSRPGFVIPIATLNGTAGKRIPVGRSPGLIAFSRGGRAAYVLCAPFRVVKNTLTFGVGMVVPVGTATRKAGRPIRVGRGPIAMTIVA